MSKHAGSSRKSIAQRRADATVPPAYIADNGDGTFDGYYRSPLGAIRVLGCVPLAVATKFIRDQTGRRYGHVPCLDRQTGDWTSELDIAEGA